MDVKPKGYRHVYIEQGKKVVEKTEAQKFLLVLYMFWMGPVFRFLCRSKLCGYLVGWYNCSRFSRKKIDPFIQRHAINMRDFVVPAGGYKSFNDFFCRSLVAGARPIDAQERVLISPADAKCWVVPEISKKSTFFVKQHNFSLQALLRDKALANYFDGGALFLLRLAPYDYHRFHAPLSGMYSHPTYLHGVLESVNPIAFRAGHMPLVENERHLILIDTPLLEGKIAMLPVGAMCVGRIGYSVPLSCALKKGDELGYFAFGGSSIVLLLPRGVLSVRADLATYTARGFEVAVRMGESLGSFIVPGDVE